MQISWLHSIRVRSIILVQKFHSNVRGRARPNEVKLITRNRDIVKTGAVGAFAPLSFKKRVLSTQRFSIKSIKNIEKLTQKSEETYKLYTFHLGGKVNTVPAPLAVALD